MNEFDYVNSIEDEQEAIFKRLVREDCCEGNKYETGLNNYLKWENVTLGRKKFDLDYNERVTNMALNETKARYEHEEKMAKIEAEKANRRSDILKAIIPTAGSLASIYLIMNFEETKVLATKALSFIIKPKI